MPDARNDAREDVPLHPDRGGLAVNAPIDLTGRTALVTGAASGIGAAIALALEGAGAKVQLLDPHRVIVEGPTRWRAAEVVCPPALRPGVVVLLAMLAAPGTSVLRNVYVINRGYEDLAERVEPLGATIEVFRDI